MGGIFLVDVLVADVQIIVVSDVIDGHEANPVGFHAGWGARK